MTDPYPPSVRVTLAPHAFPGRLLAFCGVDGAGKSTALDVAAGYLRQRGVDVVSVKMPSAEARKLSYFREYCDDHATALRGVADLPALVEVLLGDRLVTLHKQVLPALAEGRWVLCDRYLWTALAELHAVGCDERRMRVIRGLAELFPRPDVTFVADVSLDEAVRRVRSRPDERDFDPDRGLWQRFIEGFRAVSRENDLALYSSEQSMEDSADVIRDRIGALLAERG